MRAGVLAFGAATAAQACSKAKYAQCGGSSFTGDTCCPSDMWCMSTSQHWSQCEPCAETPNAACPELTRSPAAMAPGQSATGKLTWYQSYAQCCTGNPNYDANAITTECDQYNACAYPGIFAMFGSAPKSYDYVRCTNIVAFFDNSDPSGGNFRSNWGGQQIKVTKTIGGRTISFVALVADTCGNHDCSGCCSRNSHQSTGYLVDVEGQTALHHFGANWRNEAHGDVQFEVCGGNVDCSEGYQHCDPQAGSTPAPSGASTPAPTKAPTDSPTKASTKSPTEASTQSPTTVVELKQAMCRCAVQLGMCSSTCPALLAGGVSAQCFNYAVNGVCGGSFPISATYEAHCPTVGVQCVASTTGAPTEASTKSPTEASTKSPTTKSPTTKAPTAAAGGEYWTKDWVGGATVNGKWVPTCACKKVTYATPTTSRTSCMDAWAAEAEPCADPSATAAPAPTYWVRKWAGGAMNDGKWKAFCMCQVVTYSSPTTSEKACTDAWKAEDSCFFDGVHAVRLAAAREEQGGEKQAGGAGIGLSAIAAIGAAAACVLAAVALVVVRVSRRPAAAVDEEAAEEAGAQSMRGGQDFQKASDVKGKAVHDV